MKIYHLFVKLVQGKRYHASGSLVDILKEKTRLEGYGYQVEYSVDFV